MRGPGLPCVHCGLCLDTCPTYRVLGTEADSPRGRIHIMEAVKDRSLILDRHAVEHLDGCLGCYACETACPSGVSFHQRIEEFRPRLRLPLAARVWRSIVARAGASPALLRGGLTLARMMDGLKLERARRRTPALSIFPRSRAAGLAGELRTFTRSRVHRPERPRARAALLRGCVAAVLAPEIEIAAVQVLYRNGIDVIDAPAQGCCGALALHGGQTREALEMARRNTEAFSYNPVDFVVTTAAGCGAMIRDYSRLLADGPEAERARTIAEKTRDVTEVLCEVGLVRPSCPMNIGSVAYHDACHLLHMAKVAAQPRAVIEAALGRAPIDLGENTICCGSAGSYNLTQPAIARTLGRRKAELAERLALAAVAVANVGCILQLEQAFALENVEVPVVHPVELLAEAYARADDEVARQE